MPLFRVSSLLPVLVVAAGLVLAAAIVCAMSPAHQDLHVLPHAVLSPDVQGDRLTSEGPVEHATSDVHGDRSACDRPGPLEGTLRVAGDLPRPLSMIHDRPRARLPDRAADLHPSHSALRRPLTTAKFDRLPLPGGLA